MNEILSNNARVAFLQDATDAFKIAQLPHNYEKIYYKRELKRNGKGSPTHEYSKDHDTAQQSVVDNAPESVKENIQIIRAGNTTAVVAYDPETNSITIAFDPTHDIGDRIDNFLRGEKPHDLGGKVHGGLYSDLIKDRGYDMTGADNMIDVIEHMLHDYASRNDKPLSVDFTGFSKGASQAALAAAELMSRDFFENNEGLELNNLHLFGQIAFADPEFIKNFNAEIKEHGANAYFIEMHGDHFTTTLTPDGDNMFTKYNYGQVGNHAYIIPGEQGDTPQIIINPDEETLKNLRDTARQQENTHSFESYEGGLNKAATQEMSSPTLMPQANSQLNLAPS